MAQYYHVLNWRGLPGRTAAILAFGLPDESRTKMRLMGFKASPVRVMQAAQLDTLNMLLWMQTKDATKGRNRPAQILPRFLAGEETEKADLMGFDSAADFEATRNRLVKGAVNG